MNNKEIDLNLIKVLILLEKHRNLKHVALELGKTESAVSKYLSKLREQLDDYLFIRSNHGLIPTYKLKFILPQLKSATSIIESVLSKVGENIPKPCISIAFHHGILEKYGYELYKELKEKLQESKISLFQWSSNTLDEITAGNINLGIHFYDETRSKTFKQNKLFNDEFVICYTSEQEMTRNEILDRDFCICKFYGVNDYKIENTDVMSRKNYLLTELSHVDNYTLLIEMLKNNGNNTILPLSIVPKNDCQYISLVDEEKYNVEVCSVHLVSEENNPMIHDILLVFNSFVKNIMKLPISK